MKNLLGLFFNDKLRGMVTTLILISILIMVTLGYLFPKENKVEVETIESLKKVTTQIQKAAASLEEQSKLTDSANRELMKQLQEMEQSRHESYKELLDKYGIESPDFGQLGKDDEQYHLLTLYGLGLNGV